MSKLVKKIKIEYTITLVTGLHIGGNADSVEIGGIDNPVVKLSTRNNQPYIPGSSLKGKMRCLLEQMAGASKVGNDAEVVQLFGSHDAKAPRPSRLIVRDAMLTPESAKELEQCRTLDTVYTENKFENTIDRVKGTAEHPRQTERVPAGAVFSLEIIINVWEGEDEDKYLALLDKGIRAIENDYLGGSGSRGYGQVKFGEKKTTELSEANNWGLTNA